MKKQRPLTNKAGEVRELKARDFASMLPARKVLPKLIGAKATAELLRLRGRSSNVDPKAQGTLGDDADIDLSDTPEVTAEAVARGVTRVAGKKHSS
jgi:hypothetical protein